MPDCLNARSEATMAMGSVSKSDWSLHRKGLVDQQRHNEKIKDAIKQNLADIVSREDIILSDGKSVVKVPIRSRQEGRRRPGAGRLQGWRRDRPTGRRAGPGTPGR